MNREASDHLPEAGEWRARIMSQSHLPNFLVIGAAKAGTYTLWSWLQQHEDVFMSPQKETHDLAYRCKQPRATGIGPDSVTTEEAYRALFESAGNEKAVGEASPGYLCDPDVPSQIEHFLPGAKVIAILRDPADRAWSAFTKAVVIGQESDESEFLAALESEPVNNPDPWDGSRRYIRQGLYGQQIDRYFQVLGRDRVLVLFYEDLKSNPEAMLRRVFGFLGVDPAFDIDTSVSMNVTVKPRSHMLHNMLTDGHWLRAWVTSVIPTPLLDRLRPVVSSLRRRNLKRVPLDASVRAQVRQYFAEDIRHLESLLQKDLSNWRH